MNRADKALKYLAVGFLTIFVFGWFWRAAGDSITGVTARKKEQHRNLRECNGIGIRIEYFFQTNNAFPKTMKDLVEVPALGCSVRSAEILETNYTLSSASAEQAVANGKRDVPIFFEKLRYVGKEGGGFVGYALPRSVRWHEEARYLQVWKEVFGTNHVLRR